jgi:DmsE family decaheme c-type cytochrome
MNDKFKPIPRRAVLIVVFLMTAATVMASTRDSDAKKDVAADQTTAQTGDRAKYVGSETCKGCHEAEGKSIESTPHFATEKSKKLWGTPAHGCESCHGPGSAHVEAGGDKTKIFTFEGVKAEQITKRCMACHGANPEQQQFIRSTHNENGITCTSCHSVHHSKQEHLLVKQQTPLCFSCHAEQRADFQKPFHHRVEEGLIKCGDCHNPHGTLVGRQLRSTPDQDAVCFKCHGDKRGPFVFEHEPVKVEGCTACHFPHGSTNPRMLNTARTNSLCLQCHAATAAIGHTQNTRLQQCIACHSNIHGSNLSPVFFK